MRVVVRGRARVRESDRDREGTVKPAPGALPNPLANVEGTT